jgi:hypothetical protein
VIDLDQLVRLALDELDEADAARVDEHVLACGTCASALERLLGIGPALRQLVQAGKVAFPVSAGLVEQLGAAGLISRTYHLVPDQLLPCSVGPADVYAATTLEASALAGVEQIDVVRTTAAGSYRLHDVPFDRQRGRVTFVSRSDVLRKLPTCRIRFELYAVDASGERRLATYFLDHTSSAA